MDVATAIEKLGLGLGTGFAAYVSLCFLFPLGAVYQEYKIWEAKSLPSLSLFGLSKVYLFNVVWMLSCLFGSILLLPKWILTGRVEYESHVFVERRVALYTLMLVVGPVEVRGAENLPPEDPGSPAPVYIANHGSQIDTAAVYYLFRPFKWIAKKSVYYLPGVGQIMFLSNHISIDRKTGKNKSSVNSLYAKSDRAIQSGMPMFLFPQGTRRIAERLKFKDGAFNIALKNKSSIVPISIDVPLDAWNRLYPLSSLWGGKADPVILTIHKQISITGAEDKEALKTKCSDIIYSVLPNRWGGDEKKKQ